MTDKEQTITRGDRAMQILADEVFQEAIAALRLDVFNKWRDTKFGDTDGREHLKRLDEAITMLEARLVEFATDGQLAKADIARAEATKKGAEPKLA